jgi:uncharacterized protein with PIN domain
MGRISIAFEAKFRAQLRKARARRSEQGIHWLLTRAEHISRTNHLAPAEALTRVYEELASKKPFRSASSSPKPERFFCDAGLGGLARWLRAAGYEALWVEGIDDKVLLHEARITKAVVLTTDSLLMEHGLLRDGIIPSLWLPPLFRASQQLRLVLREFGLSTRAPRCMSCGGELLRRDKESLKDRIPPRTYLWLDEYFVCARCDQLFWRGTHWQRIASELNSLLDSLP